jgi:hypothetical protein
MAPFVRVLSLKKRAPIDIGAAFLYNAHEKKKYIKIADTMNMYSGFYMNGVNEMLGACIQASIPSFCCLHFIFICMDGLVSATAYTVGFIH